MTYYIYHLSDNHVINDDFSYPEVVYVGRTSNLKKRMYKHKSQKKFTSYGILAECQTLEEAKQIEDSYIVHYNQKYNRCLNKTGQYKKMNEILEILEVENHEYGDFINYLLENKIRPVFKDNYIPLTIERAYMSSRNGFY